MRRFASRVIGVIGFLIMTASADAAPVTVGYPFTSPVGTTTAGFSGTLVNLTIAEPGAQAMTPVDGVIVRWSMLGSEGGPFRLRVLRPAGPTAYTAVGTSSAATATTTGLQTFPTQLPVKAGDTLGLDVVKGLKVGVSVNPASVFAAMTPILVEGSTQSLAETAAGASIAFNAVVQPAPAVTSIAPKSGSFKGGTRVRVSGTDFASVTGVSFGGVPAKSFTVASEGRLTAVAPARRKLGKVDVAVTTVAGTSPATATDRFTFAACVVPKLKEKSLRAAKRSLRKAGCRVGKVTKRAGVTTRTGEVVDQGKRPGKKLAPGTRVSVTLG